MLIETLGVPTAKGEAKKSRARAGKPDRGIFEKIPGSGIWWAFAELADDAVKYVEGRYARPADDVARMKLLKGPSRTAQRMQLRQARFKTRWTRSRWKEVEPFQPQPPPQPSFAGLPAWHPTRQGQREPAAWAQAQDRKQFACSIPHTRGREETA